MIDSTTLTDTAGRIFDLSTVYYRADGSYVLTLCHEIFGNIPFHVPNEGEFTALHAEATAWRNGNEERFFMEPEEQAPTPTLDEEKARKLAAEAAAAEAARLAEYNSEGSRFERLRAERDRRLDETDYLLMADYPLAEDAGAVVKAYRQSLRDLPSQEGAPWDGGGEETPWPVIPEILQEQQNASIFSYTPGI